MDRQTNIFERDTMVKLPDTILREIKPGEDKTVTLEYIENKYVFSGYGPKKAKKWIREFADRGVLRYVQTPSDEPLRVTCLWW